MINEDMNEATFIFTNFFQNIISFSKRNKLSEEDLEELLKTLKMFLFNVSVSIEAKRYLNNLLFLRYDDLKTTPYIDIKILKSMIQLTYDNLCENFGPVVTDKIYSLSAQKTNQLPESLSFPAEKLFN